MVSAEEAEILIARSGCVSTGNVSSKHRLQFVIIQNGKDVLLHAPKNPESSACFRFCYCEGVRVIKCDIIWQRRFSLSRLLKYNRYSTITRLQVLSKVWVKYWIFSGKVLCWSPGTPNTVILSSLALWRSAANNITQQQEWLFYLQMQKRQVQQCRLFFNIPTLHLSYCFY